MGRENLQEVYDIQDARYPRLVEELTRSAEAVGVKFTDEPNIRIVGVGIKVDDPEGGDGTHELDDRAWWETALARWVAWSIWVVSGAVVLSLLLLVWLAEDRMAIAGGVVIIFVYFLWLTWVRS